MLLTCFNRPLAEYLDQTVGRLDRITVATIHRYKGLESPVVVLCEIDGRVPEDELASLLYVGATKARSHLVVVASEARAGSLANALER